MADSVKSYTFEEIKRKLAAYCAYQDRCHSEVEQKMRDFLLIPEAKEEILLYLIREDYLNEERFTRSYIRGKFYIKKWGRIKIKSQLKVKGVGDKLIQKCMDEIDEADYEHAMRQIWDNYFEKQTGAEYQRRAKTIKYLISRGYEYDHILRVVGGQ